MSVNEQLGIAEDERIFCERCKRLLSDYVIFDDLKRVFICRECMKRELNNEKKAN